MVLKDDRLLFILNSIQKELETAKLDYATRLYIENTIELSKKIKEENLHEKYYQYIKNIHRYLIVRKPLQ